MRKAPVNQRASVAAVLVDNFGEEDTVNAGHFKFYTVGREPNNIRRAGILFGCPCGCGALQSISYQRTDREPTWAWDGNVECPTATPSILIHQLNDSGAIIGEHWHGFLTKGVFQSC